MEYIQLRPYQEEGLKFLMESGCAGLFDETGLGKTATVLMTCERLGITDKILYICPASLKFEVEKEIRQWLSQYRTSVINGLPIYRNKLWKAQSGITIANYEILTRDAKVVPSEWNMIIIDEGHRISRYDGSGSLKRCTKIAYMVHKLLHAPRRIIMTATPVWSHPEQIWSIIEWLKPGYLNSYYSFVYRYCVLNRDKRIVGYRDLDDLGRRIAPLYIRRLKREVESSLPLISFADIPVELNANERRLYEIVKKELLFELRQNDLSVSLSSLGNSVTNVIRLRQIAGSLELVSEINKDSSKIEALKEKLEEIMKGTDEKIVIYSQFSKLIDIIARETREYNPLIIQGSVSAEDRSRSVDLFNDSPAHRVMLITSAGGQGLNLQVASNLIMMDVSSVGSNLQVIGRIERIGQVRTMFIYTITARETVDEYFKRKYFRTKAIIEKIWDASKEESIFKESEDITVGELIEALEQ